MFSKVAVLIVCMAALAALFYPSARLWTSLDDRLQKPDKFAVVFLDFLKRWSLCDYQSKTEPLQIREAADSLLTVIKTLWSLSPEYLKDEVEKETIEIPLKDGSTIRGLITRPKGKSKDELLPLIVYLHGGGWVILKPDLFVDIRNALSVYANAVVVAVDYRKAPEHKYPTAVEDVIQSVSFLSGKEKARELGLDSSRIAIAGDSAGGNLAAVVTTHFRDHPLPGSSSISHQVLIYPVTQAVDTEHGTYDEFANGYGLTKNAMDWYISQYVSDRSQIHDPRVSPLLTKNLEHLPTTSIVLAEMDVLRGDGEDYARRLTEAGVDVDLQVYPNTIHGFAVKAGNVPETAEALKAMGRRLHHSFYSTSNE